MGNRAVITFDERLTSDSIGIYVQWNGGPESIYSFVNAARDLGIRSPDSDKLYCVARFTQMICNFFGGTLSVGVGCLGRLGTANGDNGLYLIRDFGRDAASAEIYQYDGTELSLARPGQKLDWEKVRKHKYCDPKDEETYMYGNIMKANEMFKK